MHLYRTLIKIWVREEDGSCKEYRLKYYREDGIMRYFWGYLDDFVELGFFNEIGLQDSAHLIHDFNLVHGRDRHIKIENIMAICIRTEEKETENENKIKAAKYCKKAAKKFLKTNVGEE